MMLNTLIKYIKDLTNSVTIKYDKKAKEAESLSSLTNADRYIMAVTESDVFENYLEFSIDVLTLTYLNKDGKEVSYSGLPEAYPKQEGELTNYNAKLYDFAENPSLIPMMYRDGVLKAQRINTINEFVETNNYYRALNGKPPIEHGYSDLIPLTDEQLIKYEINKEDYKIVNSWTGKEKIPDTIYVSMLHEIDYYKIVNGGLFDEILKKYPNETYLRYMWNNSIDIVQARQTPNFGILTIDKSVAPEAVYETFVTSYEVSREYFMSSIYNYDFSARYDMYDNFIGLCIMLMTIQKVVSSVFEAGIKHDFYDWDFIQNLYKMYNVPFIESMSIDYHVILLKNLNRLLRYKSTDKVFFDVCSLLGYERMNIYKYYLVKKQLLDSNEEPIFRYKEVTDDFGNVSIVEDVEKMYEFYFQAVNIKDRNLVLAMKDETSRFSYNEIIDEDPYWWEDQDLINKMQNEDYNYLETKYLNLTLMYRMTELLFEITYAFRMILDKKDELSKYTITIPKIVSDSEFTVFDIVVFLIALVCKRNGFKGKVTRKPTEVSEIVGFKFTNDTVHNISNVIKDIIYYEDINEWEPYEMLYQQGFNFSDEAVQKVKEILLKPKKRNRYDTIIDKESADYINNLLDNLTITTADGANALFEHIREYNAYIINRMRESRDIDEYHAYKDIFNISMISETQNEMFSYQDDHGTKKVADTYLEYLEKKVPNLAQIVKDVDNEDIPTMIEHVLSQINGFMEDLKYLYIINEYDNPVYKALISLIRFFKSYTTDLISSNIIYLFDSKYYNMIKLMADINRISGNIWLPDPHGLHYADTIHNSVQELYKDKYEEFFDCLNRDVVISTDRDTDNLNMKDVYEMTVREILKDETNTRYFDIIKNSFISETKKDSLSIHDKLFSITEE